MDSAKLLLGPETLAEAVDDPQLLQQLPDYHPKYVSHDDRANGNESCGSKHLKRIRFSGEATNETHFSTVHGAIESGWREAEIILENLNSNQG